MKAQKQMKKVIAIACVALGLAADMALPALAAEMPPVPYLDWDDEKREMTNAVCTAYEVVTSGGSTTFAAGKTYVVKSQVGFNEIIVEGVVTNPTRLILCDGAKLAIDDGHIVVGASGAVTNALIICAQSEHEGMGELYVHSAELFWAAIGGDNYGDGGAVTINGGIVTAHGRQGSAGIGGSSRGDGGIITINGGIVTATSYTGAGIGGGQDDGAVGCRAGGMVTINGGTVTATSEMGAGIGIGRQVSAITINSGTVTINGGTVTATSSSGAGIGGGEGRDGGTVTINGGTVMAWGGDDGAGIGGGGPSRFDDTIGEGGTVTINGGTVTAQGGEGCAGIGGGQGSSSDGSVTFCERISFVVRAGDEEPGTNVTAQAYAADHSAPYVHVESCVALKIPAATAGYSYVVSNETAAAYVPGALANGTNTYVFAANDAYAVYYTLATGYNWADGKAPASNPLRGTIAVDLALPLLAAEMPPVPYLDWDPIGKRMTNATCTAATVYIGQEELGPGWYVVPAGNPVGQRSRIRVTGTAENPTHLILADGSSLTAGDGIDVVINGATTNALVIYGQELNTGCLNADPSTSAAGIGGSYFGQNDCGIVTINGGIVLARGCFDDLGHPAGIGSADWDGVGGIITINGGDVTAQGKFAPGIGAYRGRSGSVVTINGGSVKAYATNASAAGIGCGEGCFVTINGGNVTATGIYSGAGIGGSYGNGGTVTINGGIVTAQGDYGAGIGGGYESTSDGSVTFCEGISFVVRAGEEEPGTNVTAQAYAADHSAPYVHIEPGVALKIPAATAGYSYVVSNETAAAYVSGTLANGTNTYAFATNDAYAVYYTLAAGYSWADGKAPTSNPLKGTIAVDMSLVEVRAKIPLPPGVDPDPLPPGVDPDDPGQREDPTIRFSAFDYVGMYDGEVHTIDTNALKQAWTAALGEGTACMYARARDGEWTAEPVMLRDVGVTSFWYRVTSANYEDIVKPCKVAITNRSVTVTSGTKLDFTYDGKPHAYTNLTVTAGSFVAGEGIAASNWATVTTVAEGQVANTFDYAPITGTKLENYDLTVVTGKIAVVKGTLPPGDDPDPTDPLVDPDDPGQRENPDVRFSAFDYVGMYDGEAHTIDTNALKVAYEAALGEGTACMYARAKDGEWTAEPVTLRDVGVTSFWYRVTSANYCDVVKPCKVAITNRCVTLTSGTELWTYDGNAHSNMMVTVGGDGFVAGEGVTTNGFATITDVGSVPNAFSYAFRTGTLAANYAVTCVTGTLTVVQGEEPEPPMLDPSAWGTVTYPKPAKGTAYLKPNASATWKAKPADACVFAGWEWTNGAPEAAFLALSENERRNTSLKVKVVGTQVKPTDVGATWARIDEDRIQSVELTPSNLAVVCRSYVTASVSGLPGGLKFDKKSLAITGAPKKDETKTVKVSVKNASGYTWKENWTVTARGGKVEKSERIGGSRLTAGEPVMLWGDAAFGKVKGSKVYVQGKKASLKATPAKGCIFIGWYEEPWFETKAEWLPKGWLAASQSVVVPKEGLHLFARFVELRPWAVGTFDGVYYENDLGARGSVTFTVSAKGVASGKTLVSGVGLAFKNGVIDDCDESADGEPLAYVAHPVAKDGTKLTLRICPDAGIGGLGTGEVRYGERDAVWAEAVQNGWKVKGFEMFTFPTGKDALLRSDTEGDNALVLSFGAKGAVKVSGTIRGTKVSAKAQVLPVEWNEDRTFLRATVCVSVAPKKGLEDGFCKEYRLKFTVGPDGQRITAVEVDKGE